MEKRIRKKKITVKGYIKRSLIMSTVYFMLLIVWQSAVFTYNKNLKNLPPWILVLFLLVFVAWGLCYFEIRTVTKKEERFLGYKCYILFFLKLLLMPIVVLVTLLIGKYINNIFYVILANCGVTLVYYICLIAFLRPYKIYVEDSFGELHISYQIRVKKWYIEGNVK